MRVMEQGPNVYLMLAQSGPRQPLPPEAAGFFDSLRFDGKPAMAKAALPAKRKLLGKIERERPDGGVRPADLPDGDGGGRRGDPARDHDPQRRLRLAAAGRDEERPRAEGPEIAGHQGAGRAAQAGGPGPDQRPRRSTRSTRPRWLATRGPEDRGGARAYAPMQLVKGHWKVDPAPIIAARKAAAGAK